MPNATQPAATSSATTVTFSASTPDSTSAQRSREANAGDGLRALERGPQPPLPEHVAPASPYAATAEEQAQLALAAAEPSADATVALVGEPTLTGEKSFRLRMSQPVSGIIGYPLENGFKIRVPGALALDRAGPIAQAHEKVERAMILNHGDYTELTVRFVAGAAPRYRVRPRGTFLDVAIEQ